MGQPYEELHVIRQREAERRYRLRLEERRRAKERFIEAEQPESALSAVQLYRAERAKRIAAGKPVLRPLDEMRRISSVYPLAGASGLREINHIRREAAWTGQLSSHSIPSRSRQR